MTTMTYPSELVPGVPAITVAVPEGWLQLDVPSALLAAREPVAEGRFAGNVTVRHFVRPAPVSADTLVGELAAYAAGKPQGAVGPPFAATTPSGALRGTTLSYVDDAAGTIGQVHVFAVHPGPRSTSVVQLVVSFAGSRADELKPVVRGIVESLRVTWA